jgi:methyl-accepting chemotaxis protein
VHEERPPNVGVQCHHASVARLDRRWFRNRPVGVKIGTAVGACLVLLAVQGVNDLVRVGSLADASQALAQQDSQSLAALGDARAAVNRMRRRVLRLFLTPQKEHDDLVAQIRALDDQYDTSIAKLRPLGAAPAEIAQIIQRINDYQTTIASAVEEQTATTDEMSQNVSVAAESSEKVSSNISGVARAASSTTSGVRDAQRAASELAQMSSELQQLVDRFTV